MWLLTLWRICLLRANPQDLPVSTVLTVLSVAGYGAANVMFALATARPDQPVVPLDRIVQAAIVDTLLLVGLVQLVLKQRQLAERVLQTVMALTGCGVVFALVTMTAVNVVPAAVSPMLVWGLSALWLFAVYGHILRHALNVSYVAGVASAGLYFFLSLLVTVPFLIVEAS